MGILYSAAGPPEWASGKEEAVGNGMKHAEGSVNWPRWVPGFQTKCLKYMG